MQAPGKIYPIHMRKMLLWLALASITLPAAAQGNILTKIGQWSKQTVRIPEIHTASQVLAQRAETSIRQAQQAYQSLPENFPLQVSFAPVVKLTGVSSFHDTRLYPDVHFLTSTKKAGDYIVARNNRLFVNEIHRLNNLAPVLETHYPALKRRAVLLEQMPQYRGWTTPQWLEEIARLVPAQTNYLFVGEQHGFPEIQQALQEFVEKLQQNYPQRTIILFTEFLPKGTSFFSGQALQAAWYDLDKNIEKSYLQFFEKTLENGITVVGLEHPDRDYFKSYAHTVKGQQPGQLSFWNTLEGISQRNNMWEQILHNYRQTYPDALFVIHTGAGHSLYNRPYSLGTRFAKEETFMVAFYPTTSPTSRNPDPVELLYKPADLPEIFLHVTVPAHIQAAGFNIRLRIPVAE